MLNGRIYTSSFIEKLRASSRTRLSASTKYLGPTFVFLCGKAISDQSTHSNRDSIKKYIQKNFPEIKVIYSEDIWNETFKATTDLLTFEEFIAEISSMIIILTESPGSCCELGAFSYEEDLFAEKLYIALDDQYSSEDSFILSGPAAKMKRAGATVDWASLTRPSGLLKGDFLKHLVVGLNNISGGHRQINYSINQEPGKVAIFPFMLELLELIKLVEPISIDDIIELYKRLKKFRGFTFVRANGRTFSSNIPINFIIKLLTQQEFISLDGNYLRTNPTQKTSKFLFPNSSGWFNTTRSEVLMRKLKYGEMLR